MSLAKCFGLVVIGPPGSGKTTFCRGLRRMCRLSGRPAAIVNLDPANEPPVGREGDEDFAWDVDVAELVTLDDVMEELGLGPNGGMVYCAELLKKNSSWLEGKLKRLSKGAAASGVGTGASSGSMVNSGASRKGGDAAATEDGRNAPALADDGMPVEPVRYFLFDMPGQVELYTHDTSVRDTMRMVSKKWGVRLCCVNLLDSTYCNNPAVFISGALMSLSTMLRMELPQVNVLSKLDLLYGSSIDADGDPLPEAGLQEEVRTASAGKGAMVATPSEGGGPRMVFNLDFYTEATDLESLLPYVGPGGPGGGPGRPEEEARRKAGTDGDRQAAAAGAGAGAAASKEEREVDRRLARRAQRYRRLHSAIAGLIADYPMVSFAQLDITDARSVSDVLALVDRAIGYASTQGEREVRQARESLGV